jgi:Flp pilus assembly pilin Flp
MRVAVSQRDGGKGARDAERTWSRGMGRAGERLGGEGGEHVLLDLCVKMQTKWAEMRSRLENEAGAVATEYVVLLVLIALGIIVGAGVLAGALNDKFSCASSSISPISKSASC